MKHNSLKILIFIYFWNWGWFESYQSYIKQYLSFSQYMYVQVIVVHFSILFSNLYSYILKCQYVYLTQRPLSQPPMAPSHSPKQRFLIVQFHGEYALSNDKKLCVLGKKRNKKGRRILQPNNYFEIVEIIKTANLPYFIENTSVHNCMHNTKFFFKFLKKSQFQMYNVFSI